MSNDDMQFSLKAWKNNAKRNAERADFAEAETVKLQQRVDDLERSEAGLQVLCKSWHDRALKAERRVEEFLFLLLAIREDAQSGQCEIDVIRLIDQVLGDEADQAQESIFRRAAPARERPAVWDWIGFAVMVAIGIFALYMAAR